MKRRQKGHRRSTTSQSGVAQIELYRVARAASKLYSNATNGSEHTSTKATRYHCITAAFVNVAGREPSAQERGFISSIL